MNRTTVDWWAWRSHGEVDAHVKALEGVFADAGAPVRLVPRKGGYMGYERSGVVQLGDLEAGIVAWGGQGQKGWTYTSIAGAGCAWVDDWDRAQEAAECCPGYEPRRVDVALDLCDGSSSFDATLAAYRAGGFNLAGRPPKCEPMKPERPQDSAIIRIGSRTSDKFLRGYEKGKQLLGPAITAAMQREPEEFDWAHWTMFQAPVMRGGQVEAVTLWDWWRLELELKPQSADLPEDIIDRRDQYFAGAYPYLGSVLQGVEAEALVMRRERGPALELAIALENIRRTFGNTLFTALTVAEGDIGAVWERIVGVKHNKRLVKAGALLLQGLD